MVYLGLKEKKLLAGITASSGMGFILFGYDNGVMGGLLTAPDFKATFNLNSSLQGTVVAVFELGCFLGAIIIILCNNRFGRITLAWWGALSITIGALIQASSFSIGQLIVGRIVAGNGLGLISSSVPVWQSETSPPRLRGMLIACSLSFLIVGQLLAYWLTYGMSSYQGSVTWRFPLAFQAVLAILMSIMMFFMPESPRWLIKKERTQEAREILCLLSIQQDKNQVGIDIAEIKQAIALETHSKKGWFEIFKSDSIKSRRRVLLAVGINIMQTLSGSTPISYYTTYIFENSIGFTRHMALLMSGFLQIWFLIASFATWYLIEHAGRRRMFMISAFGMAIMMFVLAGMIKIGTHTAGIVAAVMIFAYQSFFTWGWMGAVWCYGPEILPLESRSKGNGIAVANQWLWNFVVVQITPPGITNIGWRMYLIFAIFNLAFVPIIYLFFPETSGFSLEMIDLAFMDASTSPVTKANELRRSMKNGKHLTLLGASERHASASALFPETEKGEGQTVLRKFVTEKEA